MTISEILNVLTQAASFIAAFATLTAAILMFSIVKKFGTGILATGFKTIAIGILIIAVAIVIEAINVYFQFSGTLVQWVIIIKQLLYVTGTMVVVIGVKKTADKLESLAK